MFIPFWCPEGRVFRIIIGDRRRLMRFEEALGDGIMRFRYVDCDEEIVLVPVGKGGETGMPTVSWMIAQFRAGVVVDPDYAAEVSEGRESVLHLDREACREIDGKSPWRFDWADAALRDGIKKTDQDATAWIKRNDHGGKKPKAASLLRWMRELVKAGGRIGALVSLAGRPKGHSQLPDVEDRLVHKWALRYWRPGSLNGRLAHKEDAAAMVVTEWDRLVEMGIPGLSDNPPSAETVRERINALECYSTHASRHGRPAADRMFSPAGEPVEVDAPFERIFMDGVEWEHSVFYSEGIKVPAAKMKSVIAMDAFSQFIFPHPTFAGKYQSEWGLRALRGVMLPPPLTQEEIDADPEAAMFYAIPGDVMIDRDRTLISPRMVPGAIKVFNTVELAEAYHSDAKAKLENYHKFVKQSLAQIPGRILGPRVKHDLGYDPIAATEVTRAQYIDMVEQCRRDWNAKPKKSLGWRSPNDIMRAFIRTGAAKLTDPKEVMRTLASTPKKTCVLTTNGLVYDNVHYRFNREDVAKALSSNYHKTSFAKRLSGTSKIEVHIRVWDDDIDMIEIFDDDNRDYFPMWSTDPGYTAQLSRWEHRFYQKQIRAGKLGATDKRDRLRGRGKVLEQRQATLAGKPFRERLETVELMSAEERRLSGKRAAKPGCAQVPELHIPTHIDGADREDRPTPPPQSKQEEEQMHLPEGAADERSDPSMRIADDLGDIDALFSADAWSFGGNASDQDEDEGED